jgi:uncharacterized membrane protein YkoI
LKKVLLTTGLSLALLAGGALATQAVGLPVAKAAASTPAVTNAQTSLEQNDATEVQGTEANDATEVKGTEANDPNEKELTPAELQAQAKITAEQSKTAALAKVKGTVQSVALEDEDNKAVYKVVVKDTAGKIQEVIVDAQTGVVVKVESPDVEDQAKEGADTETADDNK